MNMKSIRFRLTAWYVSFFLLLTAIVFASFFFMTKMLFVANTDSILSSHAETVIRVLTDSSLGMRQMLAKQTFLTDLNQIPGMVVVVLNGSGQVLNSSLPQASALATFSRMFELAKRSPGQLFTDETVERTHMRFIVSPIRNGGELSAVVLVAHPTDVIEHSLRGLGLALAGAFVLMIAPIAVGGYLVAGNALKPITRMTDELKSLGTDNLDRRVADPHTGDELERLADAFNSLLSQLSLAFNRERQFIGDVAHELKTPLATQTSGIEVALSKPRSAGAYRAALSGALTDANRLSRTLNSVLDLAWLSSRQPAGSGETVDLSATMRDLTDVATKLALRRHIRVGGSVRPSVTVTGDRDKIGRALLNIIDNAVKYTPEGGRVTIDCFRSSHSAVVRVKDTGIGIARQDLAHVPERFFRSHRSGSIPGSGLGLSIADAIIRNSRGTMEIRSAGTGRGTTVTVSFPGHV